MAPGYKIATVIRTFGSSAFYPNLWESMFFVLTCFDVSWHAKCSQVLRELHVYFLNLNSGGAKTFVSVVTEGKKNVGCFFVCIGCNCSSYNLLFNTEI